MKNKLNLIDFSGGRGWMKSSFRNEKERIANINWTFLYITAYQPFNCSGTLALMDYYIPLERYN